MSTVHSSTLPSRVLVISPKLPCSVTSPDQPNQMPPRLFRASARPTARTPAFPVSERGPTRLETTTKRPVITLLLAWDVPKARLLSTSTPWLRRREANSGHPWYRCPLYCHSRQPPAPRQTHPLRSRHRRQI